MALFKIKRGLAANLPTNSVEGYCYVTTDDKKFYIDIATAETASNSSRICLNAAYADSAGSVAWNNISSKPTFSGGTTTLAWNTSHTIANVGGNQVIIKMPANPNTDHYAWADITSKPATATRWPTWDEVTSKPSTFTPSSHTHSYLPLSGGTITGNLTLKTTYDASLANNGVSSTQYPTTFNITDKSDRIMTRMEGVIQSNGAIRGYWYVRNYNTSGSQVAQKGIYMEMNKSGDLTYNVSDAANFRSAIGVGASGTHADSYFALASHGTHVTAANVVAVLTPNFTISVANHSNDDGMIINNTTSGSALKLGYIIGTSGNGGIYDYTHSAWKVQIASNGTTTFNGNATSATKATQDGSGNTITSTYLKLSGGTMTGTLTLLGNQYTYKAGSLNCNNSNIVGVNGIFMADNCETFGEGINFYRSSTTCDAIAASNGVFYFGANVGDAALSGSAAIVSARLHANSSVDAVAGSVADVALITGPHTGTHMEFDGNEIIAKSSASAKSTLYFNENGYVTADGKIYNAVWNDFAEYRASDITEPGRVVISDGKGKVILSTERLQVGGHVVSDTYGMAVGESDQAKTPLGVAGRVLVIPYQNRNNYHVGDCLCTAPNGTADIMTREEIIKYPDRIIGIVDEIPDYEVWDQSFTTKKRVTYMHTEVNGRIWIYVR